MEKDYVKKMRVAINAILVVPILFIMAVAYMFVSGRDLAFWEVNMIYLGAGLSGGMLFSCLYGWLYLVHKAKFCLSVVGVLSLLCLLLLYVCFSYCEMLTSVAYSLASTGFVITLLMFCLAFHISIKQERDFERVMEETRKHREELNAKIIEKVKEEVLKKVTKRITKNIFNRHAEQ